MAPTLANPFHPPGWVYEEKYDGWRMIAYKDGSAVRLVSRNAVDHTARFRELAAAIATLKAPTLILQARYASSTRISYPSFTCSVDRTPRAGGRRVYSMT